jgi:hypothetical protein
VTSFRRPLAALGMALSLLTLEACDGGSVSQDPQGPAEQAPGTEGPQVSPTEED